MLILDLFCGSKSLQKVAIANNYDYVGLDLNSKCNPEILTSILDWDYKSSKLKPDIIWASPPCTEYSQFNRAIPHKVCNIQGSNAIVLRTIEIIDYFQPKYWFIENPQTGTLKNQPFMIMAYNDITYCKYGMQHRKQTRIWHNCEKWIPKPICSKASHCPNTYHKPIPSMKISERYAVPFELLNEIIKLL